MDSLFPQFMHMPPEVRRLVWEAFCPALTPSLILYTFRAEIDDTEHVLDYDEWPWVVVCTDQLRTQTLEARVIAAVHRESQYLTHRALPDTLMCYHDYNPPGQCNDEDDVQTIEIRFNRHHHLVYIYDFSVLARTGKHFHLPSFANNILYLALDMDNLDTPYFKPDKLLSQFSHIRQVFFFGGIGTPEVPVIRGRRNVVMVPCRYTAHRHLDDMGLTKHDECFEMRQDTDCDEISNDRGWWPQLGPAYRAAVLKIPLDELAHAVWFQANICEAMIQLKLDMWAILFDHDFKQPDYRAMRRRAVDQDGNHNDGRGDDGEISGMAHLPFVTMEFR